MNEIHVIYLDPDLNNIRYSQLLRTAAPSDVCQADPQPLSVLHSDTVVLAGLCGIAAHLKTTEHVVRAAAVADLRISGLLIRSGPGMVSV